jgi:hypothetical protein
LNGLTSWTFPLSGPNKFSTVWVDRRSSARWEASRSSTMIARCVFRASFAKTVADFWWLLVLVSEDLEPLKDGQNDICGMSIRPPSATVSSRRLSRRGSSEASPPSERSYHCAEVLNYFAPGKPEADKCPSSCAVGWRQTQDGLRHTEVDWPRAIRCWYHGSIFEDSGTKVLCQMQWITD